MKQWMSNKKLLFGVCIGLALVISFFLGPRHEVVPLTPEQAAYVIEADEPAAAPSAESTAKGDADEEVITEKDGEQQPELASEPPGEEKDSVTVEEEARPSDAPPAPEPSNQPATGNSEGTPKPEATVKPSRQPSATPKPAATPAPSEGGKDRYLTDPVPSGKPKPVEWQDVTVNKDKEMTITLSVTAKTILNNMKLFNEKKLEVLPEDGIIYPAQKVTFYEGESVFDVLLREMKRSKIHMEFVMTPMYNSNYVEGINNIYEFDCGELSGWMYKVNEWFPNYGASRYVLKDGDVVDWVYTCDLGRDIGGGFDAGGEQ